MQAQIRTKKDRQNLARQAKEQRQIFLRYADKMNILSELIKESSTEDLISIYEPTLKRWQALDYDEFLKAGILGD